MQLAFLKNVLLKSWAETKFSTSATETNIHIQYLLNIDEEHIFSFKFVATFSIGNTKLVIPEVSMRS